MKGKRRNPKDPPAEFRFKPGQSGNPSGLPGKSLVRESLRDILKKKSLEIKPETNAQAVALVQIRKAIEKKDTFAAGFVTENAEGKLSQHIVQENVSKLPHLSDDKLAEELKKGGSQK